MADEIVKYYGAKTFFNDDVTFYKDVNIQGNINYDSLTVKNITVTEQSTLNTTTITNLSTNNLSVSGITTAITLSTNNLSVSGVSTLGITTITNLSTNNLSVSGITTAITLSTNNLSVSGVSTLGQLNVGGIVETVSVATTYMSGSNLVIEMDVRQATVYNYILPTGANIGIVSFKNIPVQTNKPSASTVTCLFTQNLAGTSNITPATGIGTNCTVVGYENGSTLTGISTRGLVGSAATVTLSTTGSDVDFVTFFVQYNGSSTTTASSYKVYITSNGSFRRGNIGI